VNARVHFPDMPFVDIAVPRGGAYLVQGGRSRWTGLWRTRAGAVPGP
jgi:hypothetical protein